MDIFSNICTAHAQKRLFMNFRCKFRLRFPVRVQNFGDVATFSVDYCILYSECPPYFYFRFVWPTDLESIRVDPHVDNSHQVWSWYDHPLPSYSVLICWYVTWPCELDLCPFDLEQSSFMASHVHNLANKFEDLTPISSWVTSYNGSHWLQLKMCTRPLRMRRITWPMSRGLKRLHFWNPRPRFAYSPYKFGGSTMNIIKPQLPAKIMCGPVLKYAWDSAHPRNHVIC